MPKFAANLSMMFNEWDFLDRFKAAADTGFTAVEFLFPYAYAPDEVARRLQNSGLTQALRHACAVTAPLGIDILIEPINGRDMPGYFLNDFPFAALLIAELALPNLKLQFDIYHRQILHGDVMRGLDALLPITGHVQVASVPKRNEPGTGELDDVRIFRHLDQLGYDGYVGCEYRPAGHTVEGLGWFRNA